MKTTLLKSAARVLATMGGRAHAQVNMLDVVYTKLMMGEKKATKTFTDANKRAKAVIKARSSGWPDVSGDRITRQRLRQSRRLRAKQAITVAKAHAMKAKIMGGSAQIRTELDAAALMV